MSVYAYLKNRFSPLEGLMTVKDYRAARRLGPLTPGSTNVQGQETVFSDAPGLFHSLQEIYKDEVYKFKAKHKSPRIIDAGANIGLSVRYFKSLYPDAQIIAYEPDPQMFALLVKNVGHIPGVELRDAAAWIEDTNLTFFTEGSLAGSTEIDLRNAGKPVTVRAERLRDEIAKAPVDFLKIDIEGAENSVMFDIEDVLDGVDHLFFEYHSKPGEPQKLGRLLNLVQDHGFRYAINGTHCAKHPYVETPGPGFDLQLNVLCHRESSPPA